MRTLYRIPLGLLVLAMVISLAAAAQTSAPPSQSQVSSQAQTSATPPQPQTSHEGQTSAPPSAPPSQAAPQGQTGSNANPQPNQAQEQEKSIEDELQLTPDQKQKIATIVDDENKQIVAVRGDSSLSMDQKVQKARAIRQAGAPKIKAVLTPEQLQKLSAIQERARQQQQQQNSPAAPPKPQQ
jgi:Spy/CpxP family protein refolding chaperone